MLITNKLVRRVVKQIENMHVSARVILVSTPTRRSQKANGITETLPNRNLWLIIGIVFVFSCHETNSREGLDWSPPFRAIGCNIVEQKRWLNVHVQTCVQERAHASLQWNTTPGRLWVCDVSYALCSPNLPRNEDSRYVRSWLGVESSASASSSHPLSRALEIFLMPLGL
jgi:hypothetical protein